MRYELYFDDFKLGDRFTTYSMTVTEEAIIDAVKFLFYRTKLVVEPSGALGVAALLSGAVQVSGRVGIVRHGRRPL